MTAKTDWKRIGVALNHAYHAGLSTGDELFTPADWAVLRDADPDTIPLSSTSIGLNQHDADNLAKWWTEDNPDLDELWIFAQGYATGGFWNEIRTRASNWTEGFIDATSIVLGLVPVGDFLLFLSPDEQSVVSISLGEEDGHIPNRPGYLGVTVATWRKAEKEEEGEEGVHRFFEQYFTMTSVDGNEIEVTPDTPDEGWKPLADFVIDIMNLLETNH